MLSACASRGSFQGQPLNNIGDSAPELVTSVKPIRLLVIGGTSGIGLEVVKLALKRGHRVTAVARHPEKMPIKNQALFTLKADITNIESMMGVVDGKDVVVSAVGIAPTLKTVNVFSTGIRNVLLAMRKFDVQRLFTITAVGVGDSVGHGGFVFDEVFKPILKTDLEDKNRQEKLIKASQVDWTIVRPSVLTNGQSKLEYRILTDVSGIETGSISRADVAHFIVASFENQLYVKETVLLTN